MVTVTVEFWGPARDMAGVESCLLELAESARMGDVRRAVADRFPALFALIGSVRLAANEEFVDGDEPVGEGDRIAVIPPVSGGGDEGILVEIVKGPISAGEVHDFVRGDPALGGIATFEGATRAQLHAEYGALVRLDYEAHASMARRQMMNLARDAKRRWGIGRVAMVHRIGPVGIAEVSVMIAVAGEHRAQVFDACRWLIDSLKRVVPIWKKEVYKGGQFEWVMPDQQAGAIPPDDARPID